MLHARALLQLSKRQKRTEACVPNSEALKLCSSGNRRSLLVLWWQGL